MITSMGHAAAAYHPLNLLPIIDNLSNAFVDFHAKLDACFLDGRIIGLGIPFHSRFHLLHTWTYTQIHT